MLETFKTQRIRLKSTSQRKAIKNQSKDERKRINF